MTDGGDRDVPTYTAGFWSGLVLGVPVVAYGVCGLIDALPGVQLTSFVQFFVGGAVIHDVLVAPAVCIIGWTVLRRLPRVAVAPVQVALVVSAVVALVSWPFVRAYGITPGEPSFLSRNYTASVLIVWAVVWSAAAIAIAARVIDARRR